MKILIFNQRNDGSMALGVFVILCVVLFMAMLFMVGARASKWKPRTLPDLETNAFYYIYIDDVAQMPQPQSDPNPPAIVRKSSSDPLFFSFTNRLYFYETNVPVASALFIERTHDLVSWTVLYWVMFDEPVFTNGTGYQTFVDLYAPIDGMSIYRTMIPTNGP